MRERIIKILNGYAIVKEELSKKIRYEVCDGANLLRTFDTMSEAESYCIGEWYEFWDIDQEKTVTEAEVMESWQALTGCGEYDGSFHQYLYDECLGKNGSLITMAEHEADLRKLAEDEARAEADFSPI